MNSRHRLIYLTGFMGAGKTTVGRLLARETGYAFVDLDEVIVETQGKSITDIFASSGESVFRLLESEALEQVSLCDHTIVATGGGAVISPLNRRLMQDTGMVVNLAVSAEQVAKRLAEDNSRPLLAGVNPLEQIESLLDKRISFYSDADMVIDTLSKSPEDITHEILLWLKTIK